MQTIDTTPGLSAWNARRRSRRRTWTHRAVLLTGLAGAGLYALPHDVSPLVHAGILSVPQAPHETLIPQVSLAIAVQPKDLPKLRPSLSAARTADQIEAAQVIGVLPTFAPEPLREPLETAAGAAETQPEFNQSGSSEPMFAVSDEPDVLQTATLPTPRKIAPPAIKPQSAKSNGDEDVSAMRKRVFSPER